MQQHLCNAHYLDLTFHQTSTSLSLFCINCRSLNAHWDALKDLLYTMCVNNFFFDFIGLTEVFQIEKDQHFTLNGYHQLENNTRPSSDGTHGGVGLFINENLNYINVTICQYLFRM